MKRLSSIGQRVYFQVVVHKEQAIQRAMRAGAKESKLSIRSFERCRYCRAEEGYSEGAVPLHTL